MIPFLSDPTNGNPRGDGFGPRALYGFHHGLDIGFWSAKPDYRVYVSAPGRVVEVGWNDLVGWYIIINLGDGWTMRYCHFASRPTVKVGQDMFRRQLFATMGNTGSQASGTHLHMELAKNGIRVDPAPYFSTTAGGGGSEIIPEESDIDMSEVSYLYKPKGATPAAYGVFGQEIPGGSYIAASITEAEALGAMYGTRIYNSDGTELRVGAPFKAMSEAQWPVLIAVARKLSDIYYAAITVGGGSGSTDIQPVLKAVAGVSEQITKFPPAPSPADVAKAVNDDAAARLQS